MVDSGRRDYVNEMARKVDEKLGLIHVPTPEPTDKIEEFDNFY